MAYQHTILKIEEFDRSEGQEKVTTKRWNFEDSVEIYQECTDEEFEGVPRVEELRPKS